MNWFKKNLCSIAIFILFFLISLSNVTEPAGSTENPEITIRLFTLLKPKKIIVFPAKGLSLTVVRDSREPLRLAPGREAIISKTEKTLLIKTDNTEQEKAELINISPNGGRMIGIDCEGIGKRLYSGRIYITNHSEYLLIHLVTKLEDLADQIIVSEMSNRDVPEALKAQNIIIRTYLYYNLGRHSEEGFDYCDTTHCQVMKGWDTDDTVTALKISNSLDKLLSESKGLVLTYKGKLIEGYYTAACGGYTATPELLWGGKQEYPYRQTNCPFCNESQYYRWERSINKSDFIAALGIESDSFTVETESMSDKGGYIKTVIIRVGTNTKRMGISEFRKKIADKLGWNKVISCAFDIKIEGNEIIFKGRGFGHGIGFCQHGAEKMGKIGYNWKNILDFYFPGCDVIQYKPELKKK